MKMTNFNFPPEVQDYIDIVEQEKIPVCEEQKQLIKHIKLCFSSEDIYIDMEQLANYMRICDKYLPITLFPWERFLIALHDCTYYTDSGEPRWSTQVCFSGRGTGKDGMITAESFCLLSPYNKIDEYDIDICALNEEQAMRPVEDLTTALDLCAKKSKKIRNIFYWTKQLVKCKKKNAKLKGRTNNPKGKDGMKSGIIIFNEVHGYENYDNINVFKTGLGKKGHPRTSYYSSNGEVREGPYDELEEECLNILASDSTEDYGILPFICRLHDEKEIDSEENWYKANPSLYYFPHLMTEIRSEYREWKKHPDRFTSFPNKRMGLKCVINDTAVTSWDNIKATNKPLPDLTNQKCVAGIDFSKTNDWMSVVLHFRQGEKRYDIHHSWICAKSADLPNIKAPWKMWVKQGHCTYVDDLEIHPSLVRDYLEKMGKKYNIMKVCIDRYRYSLLSSYLNQIGYSKEAKNIMLVRQTDIITAVPVIEHYFIQQTLYWGDSPPMRWAANNTKVIKYGKNQGADKGSFVYAKIEGKRRKTDPFFAFVAAVCGENDIPDYKAAIPPSIPVIKL